MDVPSSIFRKYHIPWVCDLSGTRSTKTPRPPSYTLLHPEYKKKHTLPYFGIVLVHVCHTGNMCGKMANCISTNTFEPEFQRQSSFAPWGWRHVQQNMAGSLGYMQPSNQSNIFAPFGANKRQNFTKRIFSHIMQNLMNLLETVLCWTLKFL